MNLTPYDTDEVAEPFVWDTFGERDRYGRVDFDCEGITVATVWASRNQDGSYTLHVTGDVTIEHDKREV